MALAGPAFAGSGPHTRVVVKLAPGAALPPSLQPYAVSSRLDSIGANVLDVPNAVLSSLGSNPAIAGVDLDRPVTAQDFRTDISAGSFFANHDFGYTGRGVTVAVIDSGVDASVDDLRNRVVGFVDFTSAGCATPCDDNGHGTHVAGIIAGSGRDSAGKQAGIAPGAQIVSLKVLDANGQGNVSDVIKALDWIAKQHDTPGGYKINVVNLSLAAKVLYSYADPRDLLAAATKALVDRGIIVVAAAGNHGSWNGEKVWGAIGAPGNEPWVVTVGASSSMGTLTRTDDTTAAFSSRGPTRFDYAAKPDILAGGVGIVSTSAPGSTQYQAALVAGFLLPGTAPSVTMPYEVMTGTSMSTPAVAATFALMLEANPRLTPNFAKAVIEYTAQWNPAYRALEQGAGFLNTLGAVELSAFYAHAHNGDTVPTEAIWGRHIVWGNYRVAGGVLVPGANAWSPSVTWGDITVADDGENIVWGTDDFGNIVWGTDDSGNIIWGTNVVWGADCGGSDCENIIWGTDDGSDNIIWGTDDGSDNIIWGTDDSDNIIWGTDDGSDNIIWGTLFDSAQNIVWGTGFGTGVPATTNPSYQWFLDRSHDARWLRSEFGDASLTLGQGR